MELIAKGWSALKEVDRVIDYCELNDRRLIPLLKVMITWITSTNIHTLIDIIFVLLSSLSLLGNWENEGKEIESVLNFTHMRNVIKKLMYHKLEG